MLQLKDVKGDVFRKRGRGQERTKYGEVVF